MIRIVVDSSCDITQDEAKKLNITVLPLTITINGEDFKDDIDITKDEFYKLLKTEKKLPKTSQISPSVFEAIYEDAKDNEDEVLVITIAKALSGTANSARIAMDLAEYDKVEIVDSCSVIGGFQILVKEAVLKRDEGKSLNQIADYLNNLKQRIRIWGCINNLEYLKKGGRLSSIEAAIGALMNIKPIITFDSVGKIKVSAKSLGITRSTKKVIELIEKHPIDFNHEVIYYYSDNKTNLDKFITDFKPNKLYKEGNVVNLSPVVGTHIGENCYAICYIEQEKSEG